MDIITANRVIALQRQIGQIKAMFKKGDLTPAEADVLTQAKRAEIEAVRAQQTLDLSAKKK